VQILLYFYNIYYCTVWSLFCGVPPLNSDTRRVLQRSRSTRHGPQRARVSPWLSAASTRWASAVRTTGTLRAPTPPPTQTQLRPPRAGSTPRGPGPAGGGCGVLASPRLV
jgi:hypothetical protein